MLHLENKTIAVYCQESGRGLAVLDIARGTRWSLDEKTTAAGQEFTPSMPAVARLTDSCSLTITFRQGDIQYDMLYTLKEGYIEIRLPVPESDVHNVALPGSFTPGGEKLKLLLPIMQGMLWDGRGEPFEQFFREAGHLGFSMPFIGYMGETGGLLYTSETQDDVLWWVGKDDKKRIWAANMQVDSLGSLRYERIGRLYVTEPDITAIAKTYRRKVIEQGRFVSWEEKLEKRPQLERLFGALMCYVGYCRDDINYAEECRKLKAYGFDRALVYPGRFNIYYPDIRMGGEPAIDMTEEMTEGIRALGYDVAPWTWINEALDDGTEKIHAMYRKGPNGSRIPNWAIDSQQWYLVCSTFLEEFYRGSLNTCIPDMTWDHFDVLACISAGECHATDHPGHLGRPVSITEDREWIKKTFRTCREAGRFVSSENFNDAYSTELDFGSVKAWPQYGHWPFWPIPLTMLVYHDSMIHSWWELHSYNNQWRGRTQGGKHYEYGGGRPRLMAAMDALYGCPPDVFPFGAQYGYSGKEKETFLYKYRFEDPEVQIALKAALPVTQLHRRIGRLEMVDFKILSDDGYIQESTFSDGTKVLANFSRDFYGNTPGVDHIVVAGVEPIAPESWKVIR